MQSITSDFITYVGFVYVGYLCMVLTHVFSQVTVHEIIAFKLNLNFMFTGQCIKLIADE